MGTLTPTTKRPAPASAVADFFLPGGGSRGEGKPSFPPSGAFKKASVSASRADAGAFLFGTLADNSKQEAVMSDHILPNCILRATVDGYKRLYNATDSVEERLSLWRKEARLKAEMEKRVWKNDEQNRNYARALLKSGVRP